MKRCISCNRPDPYGLCPDCDYEGPESEFDNVRSWPWAGALTESERNSDGE